MDSICIKGVSFLEILSEWSISRTWMCKHAVELTAITHLKWDGLKYSNLLESVMVFYVFITWLTKKC